MRSITTGVGDKGETRLFSGETVDKHSSRPDTYGDIDELVSALGLARVHCTQAETASALLYIQRHLFVIGSEVATMPSALERLPRRIDRELLDELDTMRSRLEAEISLPKGFIVPGGNAASAHLHMARSVTRRCERKLVGLHRQGQIANDYILVWMNRLSDYLFLLALAEDHDTILVKQP